MTRRNPPPPPSPRASARRPDDSATRRRPQGAPLPEPAAGTQPLSVAGEDSSAAPAGIRLSKVMAERGMCSRREADALIEQGWVFVDGQRISELGTRIRPDAKISLAPEAKARQARQVTILLNKPVGYVSGQPEPGFTPAVSLIRADNQFGTGGPRFHPSQLKGLAPAGRLDIDSTGLLVLTQDGRIARQLIGDDSRVDKEYLVRVEGPLSVADLRLLNHGLSLDGQALRPARVEWLNADQLRFVLREGRKRQIRRMCELVGLKVTGLRRIRIGRVKLGDLPLGQWRYLRDDEAF
jgi:23S rRNA pseudouridine2604 synthase